jgi:hypothetical protein
VEQATDTTIPAPTTPAVSTEPAALAPERQAYQRASEVLDRIVGELDTLPRQAAVIGDLHGFRIRINFGTNDPKGVLEFAAIADVQASRDHGSFGVWFEARATIENIPVCAEVLLSAEAATAFGQQSPPPNPGPDDATAPTQVVSPPVPLGASVIAVLPTVTETQDGAR